MDINDIRKKFNDGGYTVKMNIPNKVADNYVFDEELSVKKNRELIIEHNKKVDKLRKEKNDY